MIASLQYLVAAGDHGFAVAGRRAEQELPVRLERLADLGEVVADEDRCRADHGTEHEQLAVRHRVDLVGAGDVGEFHDLVGGVGVGVDDHVGTHRRQQLLAHRAAQLFGLDAHDRLLHAEFLGEQRCEEIDLVVLGDPGEQVGALDAGRSQRRRHRRTSDHHLHVEFGADRCGDHLVLFDDHHVVAFGTQPLGEVPPDLTGTDDHDMHRPSLPHRPDRSRTLRIRR